LFYIAVITLLVLKIRAITRDESGKYSEAERLAEADKYIAKRNLKHGWFFKSLSHKYSVFFGMPMMFFMAGLIGLIGIGIKLLLVPKGYENIVNPAMVILFIPALFISISLIFLPSFYIKHPIATIMTLDAFNGTRKRMWIKAHAMLLIVFTVAFPFYSLALDYYGYFNEEKIIANNYFQIIERTVSYEEITRIDRYFTCNRKGETTGAEYAVYGKGKFFLKMDIGTNPGNTVGNNLEKVIKIHTTVLSKNPGVLSTVTIKEQEMQYLAERYPDDLQKLLYVLGHEES